MSEQHNGTEEEHDPSRKEKRRFRTVLREEEIELENKDGVVKEYIVREMMGDEKERWQTTQGDRVRIVDGKPAGIRDFKDMQPGLVARCLFEKETGKQMSIQEIRKWPASMLEDLYELCLDVCGFTKESQEEVKKV